MANYLEALRSVAACGAFSESDILRLKDFSNLLFKWNQKINLVSKKVTEDELWQRHILDSAQIIPHLSANSKKIVDYGSGAGFPAIILAILGDYEVTLIESDQRKCAFMQQVATQFNLNIKIITSRIENVAAFDVDVITSRALAPLTNLLEYSHPFSNKNNYMLFLKGQNVVEEIKEASIYWDYDYKLFPDALNKEGGVVKISNLRRL